MKYRVRFKQDARQDIEFAYAWYEQQSEGLGTGFLHSVSAATSQLGNIPLIHAIEYNEVRRAHLKRFPYSLHFLIEADEVIVLGCIHQRRNPAIWPTG